MLIINSPFRGQEKSERRRQTSASDPIKAIQTWNNASVIEGVRDVVSIQNHLPKKPLTKDGRCEREGELIEAIISNQLSSSRQIIPHNPAWLSCIEDVLGKSE